VTAHPYITETPLRISLREQLARLVRVVDNSDQPWRVEEATRHAAKLRRWVECETDIALTLKPVEQVLLQVEDICRHLERDAFAEDLFFTRAIPHVVHGMAFVDRAA